MNQSQSVWNALLATDEPLVLATVVETSKSSYRGPGARMIIRVDGDSVGEISGGCLERDVFLNAKEVYAQKSPKLLTYETGSEGDIVWGTGVGCVGKTVILLEYLSGEKLGFYQKWARVGIAGKKAFLATSYTDDSLGQSALFDASFYLLESSFVDDVNDFLSREFSTQNWSSSRLASGMSSTYQNPSNSFNFLMDAIVQPTRLIVFGAGNDAMPVCSIAGVLGWDITVVDHRDSFATEERFPSATSIVRQDPAQAIENLDINSNTIVLIMTHIYLTDKEVLKKTLSLNAAYVGQLGPKNKAERLVRELEAEGIEITPEWLDRFYSPVGLDIGSETSEEVALSMVSEIQAVIKNRRGGFLRDRKSSIHGSERGLWKAKEKEKVNHKIAYERNHE